MPVYLASQPGTSETSLIADFPSKSQYQQVLANQTDVPDAQSAVFTNPQQRYAVTLTAPAFLTTPLIVGQAAVDIDSDLGALATAGAIDADGMSRRPSRCCQRQVSPTPTPSQRSRHVQPRCAGLGRIP